MVVVIGIDGNGRRMDAAGHLRAAQCDREQDGQGQDQAVGND
jgi:hypothetical protein